MSTPAKQMPAAPAGTSRSARRRGGPAGASVARRSLERDLARREASLRINRRASGPAGGVARGPLPGSAASKSAAAFFDEPPQAAPAAPAVAPAPTSTPAPIESAPAGLELPAFIASPQATPASAPARVSPRPGFSTRQAPAQAPHRVGAVLTPQPSPVTAAGSAAVAVAIPIADPAAAPKSLAFPKLQTLRGGLSEYQRPARLSNVPAMVVGAVVLLVITVGFVLATQIAMTQVNEQIGADLGQITRLEQTNTALRETNSSKVAAAPVLGAARSRGLVEPSPGDVRAVRAGDRSLTAERAARALRRAGIVPVAGAAATGDAAASTPGTTPGATASGAATTESVTGTATPTDSTVTADATAAAGIAQTP